MISMIPRGHARMKTFPLFVEQPRTVVLHTVGAGPFSAGRKRQARQTIGDRANDPFEVASWLAESGRMGSSGWHFLIAEDGRVASCVPVERVAAHVQSSGYWANVRNAPTWGRVVGEAGISDWVSRLPILGPAPHDIWPHLFVEAQNPVERRFGPINARTLCIELALSSAMSPTHAMVRSLRDLLETLDFDHLVTHSSIRPDMRSTKKGLYDLTNDQVFDIRFAASCLRYQPLMGLT